MKKTRFFALSLSFLCLGVSWSATPTYNINPTPPQKKLVINTFYFYKPVFDKNGFVVDYDETVTDFSKSKKESYCWSASIDADTKPFQPIKYTEIFQTPEKSLFTSDTPTTKITSSDDEKMWIVQSTETINEFDNTIGSCWTLTEDDPLGNYVFSIAIEGQQQPEIRFNVVE